MTFEVYLLKYDAIFTNKCFLHMIIILKFSFYDIHVKLENDIKYAVLNKVFPNLMLFAYNSLVILKLKKKKSKHSLRKMVKLLRLAFIRCNFFN